MSGKRKRSESSPNEDIVSVLLELAEWERNTNRATHKANAYKKAAAVISALDHRYIMPKVLPRLPLICFRRLSYLTRFRIRIDLMRIQIQHFF